MDKMDNRVEVEIANKTFRLLSSEDEAYVRKVAEYAEQSIRKAQEESRRSMTDALILTCMNLADECFKERAVCESLRTQLSEYIEDLSKIKGEVGDLRRQLSRQEQSQKNHSSKYGR